jgi:hypothetical protein
MQDEMWRQGKEITGECGLWNKRKNTQDIVLSPWLPLPQKYPYPMR